MVQIVVIAVGNHQQVEHGTNARQAVHQCGDQDGQLAQAQSQMTQTRKLVNDVVELLDNKLAVGELAVDEVEVVVADGEELASMTQKQQ